MEETKQLLFPNFITDIFNTIYSVISVLRYLYTMAESVLCAAEKYWLWDFLNPGFNLQQWQEIISSPEYPALIQCVLMVLSLWGNVASTWSWLSPPSNAKFKNKCSYTPTWLQGMHMDFTLTYCTFTCINIQKRVSISDTHLPLSKKRRKF